MMKAIIVFAALLVITHGSIAQVGILRIRANTTKAKLVALGEVITVGPKMGFWSGQFAAFQEVHYYVIQVLKGSLGPGEIVVKHPVVKNSETADLLVPQLSPRLFFKGNRVLLFLDEITAQDLSKDDVCLVQAQFKAFDEHFGVVLAPPELLETLNKSSE
jgi:hypothetical protein